MINTDKTVDGKDQEIGVPGLLAGMKQTGVDLSEYKVRVERFVIDADGDDIYRLESLYTRGLDGSSKVIIMKENRFTDKDQMIVVITYMEKKLREDPVEAVKKSLEV